MNQSQTQSEHIARVAHTSIGADILKATFSVTSGLTLSQVRELTGIDSPALHNWIKRGWLSSPVGKRYQIDQVARILIINMLRDVMQLEKIAFLLSYINGSVDDRTDDIIPEYKLYEIICKILTEQGQKELIDDQSIQTSIVNYTSTYIETIPGATNRLRTALKIILTAYLSARLKSKAEEILTALRADTAM